MSDVKVQLPPGCEGVQVAGRTYMGRAGTHTMVPPEHARLIAGAEGNGTAGVLDGRFRVTFRARGGRACPACNRRWHRWTAICYSCGAATEPE